MSTFLVNHLLHESERLSLTDQMKLARRLLDRIRQESMRERLEIGLGRLRHPLRRTDRTHPASKT